MSRSPAEAAASRLADRVAELEAELEAERSLRRQVEAARNHLSRLLDDARTQRDDALAGAIGVAMRSDATRPSGEICEGRR